MTLKILVFGLVLFTARSFAIPTKCLHFIINVPPQTPRLSKIYVTGDRTETCSWKADCMPMHQIGPSTYQADITYAWEATVAKLKVTRGDWAKEAAWGNGSPVAEMVVKIDDEQTTFIKSIANWRDLPPLGVTGDVRRIPAFHSPQLGNDRDIYVLVPPGYDKHRNQKYPVIYLHDGQNVFDPATATFGVDMQVDEAVAKLLAANEVKEAILVAVSNTSGRDDEYDHSLKGEVYSRFLIDTLKPYIDSHYRTEPDRDHTFTMGASLGASIAISLLWYHADTFSKAAAISFPVFYRNSVMFEILKNVGKPLYPVRMYFDHGDTGQDAGYEGSVRRLYDWMLTAGIPAGDIEYRMFSYADHNEVDWARRVQYPLRFLLGGVLR